MRPSMQAEINGRLRAVLLAVLSLWFVLILCGSLWGVFDGEHRAPIPLGAATVLPVTAFTIAFLRSPALRQVMRATNLRLLVLAHTWRLGGVVFLILQHRGILPGVFALPAGWGDIAIGATAPLVAWALSSQQRPPGRIFVLWNGLGILDLLMAVTLGLLSSASPWGILAKGVTTRPMGAFPLSMIPAFFVPLLIILHVIALGRVSHGQPTKQLAAAAVPAA